MKKLFIGLTMIMLLLFNISNAHSTLITGTFTDWHECCEKKVFGDGTNEIKIYWSVANSYKGWFYGTNGVYTGPYQYQDIDIAYASGISDVSQITNANDYFIGGGDHLYVGPIYEGEIVVYRNNDNGYFGALKVDDFHGSRLLDATWYFQDNQSADFSNSNPVPEPSTIFLLGAGLAGLALFRRKKTA